MLVEHEVINLLMDMADDGFKAAEEFVDDFMNEKVKYLFYADHKALGSFNEATAPGILKISPFGRKLELRDAHEIASTIIHEYMHFRGYNEFTAHWVQFTFMLRMMAKKPGMMFPSYAKHISKFQNVISRSGAKAAEGWLTDFIVDKGYNLAHYGGSRRQFIRGVTNYAGGRYKEIESIIKTGFFPEEFLPKTLRGV